MSRKIVGLIAFLLISLLLLSCNEEKALKKKLMSELYAAQDIIIDGKSMTCANNTVGFDEELVHLPVLRIEGVAYFEQSKSKWDIEIKDGKNYLIIKDTWYKGRYEIEFFDHDNKVVFTSDQIIIKVQRAL